MKRIGFYIVGLLLLSSCGGKETKDPPAPNVYEVKNIGQLSTTEYTIGKIVKVDDPPEEWYKFGDRKILISCKAKVKAGVDLNKIKKGDITVSGKTIEIVLPPAEITTFTMDPKEVHTKMESVSGFRDRFSQIDKNDFMRQGEEAIRKDLKETGILKDAQNNAETFIKDFYHQMGFEKVIVRQQQEEKKKDEG